MWGEGGRLTRVRLTAHRRSDPLSMLWQLCVVARDTAFISEVSAGLALEVTNAGHAIPAQHVPLSGIARPGARARVTCWLRRSEDPDSVVRLRSFPAPPTQVDVVHVVAWVALEQHTLVALFRIAGFALPRAVVRQQRLHGLHPERVGRCWAAVDAAWHTASALELVEGKVLARLAVRNAHSVAVRSTACDLNLPTPALPPASLARAWGGRIVLRSTPVPEVAPVPATAARGALAVLQRHTPGQ